MAKLDYPVEEGCLEHFPETRDRSNFRQSRKSWTRLSIHQGSERSFPAGDTELRAQSGRLKPATIPSLCFQKSQESNRWVKPVREACRSGADNKQRRNKLKISGRTAERVEADSRCSKDFLGCRWRYLKKPSIGVNDSKETSIQVKNKNQFPGAGSNLG